jgi:hypothetical protein
MPFEKYSPNPKPTTTRKRARKIPGLAIADELTVEIAAMAERWDTTVEQVANEALRIGLEAIGRRSEAYNRRAFGTAADE